MTRSVFGFHKSNLPAAGSLTSVANYATSVNLCESSGAHSGDSARDTSR